MTASTGLVIPEIGSSLGRLVAPPPATARSPAVALEDVRLALVSELFELTGDARRWMQEGDRELALATLNRDAWVSAWNRAVEAAASRVAQKASERLLAAAREARLPARRIRTLALDADETRALAARLGRGAAPLHEALAHLDQAAHHARTDRAAAAVVAAWQEALATAARRLEAAWLTLEEAVAEEWQGWESEVADLRRWRRPLWPLLLTGVMLFGVSLYLGLILGGYLPVPGLMRPLAEAIWARWN